jgi:hypothetical protein
MGLINVSCYNSCHGNSVKGHWALQESIYEYAFTTLDFPIILDGQLTSLTQLTINGFSTIEIMLP